MVHPSAPVVILLAGLSLTTTAARLQYSLPSKVPRNATPLDCTPVGVSMEFFMWPSYMTNITPPMQCISRFSDIYGDKMPIRIGGTTQDRATYNPSFDGYVSYTVVSPLDAPDSLTYGRRFWDLINVYEGETMLGFNQGDNNQTNTYLAVVDAKERALSHLWAVELGNEPDVYLWQNKSDASPLPILTGGSYAVAYDDNPEWPNTDYLINTAYNDTVKAAVLVYVGHLYAAPPGNNTLATEMNHAKTVSDLAVFADRIATAASVNRSFILGTQSPFPPLMAGETNFHPYDVDMDATFGAAMQTLDKSLHAVTLGIKSLFFHQGTINQALFNWWSDNQINAPFYGGYFAALALGDGDHIVELDSGNSSYAQYVIYRQGRPTKVVLLNADYYSGSGERSNTSITLDGLWSSKVKALRMTAASSDVTTNGTGTYPTIGGQYFSNVDCSSIGALKYESTTVSSGEVTLTIAASEALLVYL
ncbi:hypothetical protein ZTR_05294 [Talaromyces verruculosus]|nr:hypothetical protein ZTR_05294 [Talaromyces verruculosus]